MPIPGDDFGCQVPIASNLLYAEQAGAGQPVAPPSNTDFTARYPAFAGVAPGTLTAVLAEAANEVDTTWRTVDQIPAVMALAAHLLVAEGLVGSSIDLGGVSLSTSGPITSYAAGDTKMTFASSKAAATSAESADLGSTVYGRRFLDLQTRNVVAAAFVV